MSIAVTTFGRFNPPTVGHLKLVNAVVRTAKKVGGTPLVYLSHSQDYKKNPLPYSRKLELAQKAFGRNVVQRSSSKNIIQVMQELEKKGYSDVVVLAGSDRVAEFERLLNRYNGSEYSFKSIEVKSAGDRDPDAEGVAGMSASKMRAAAKDGDYSAFLFGLPPKLTGDADEIWSLLREDISEVLSVQQRRRASMRMRRLASKFRRIKKRLQNRMADAGRLKGRARRAATKVVRQRVAGMKGKRYGSLPPKERENIDRKVKKRKDLIDRLARRMLPVIRKKERARLQSRRSKTNEERRLPAAVVAKLRKKGVENRKEKDRKRSDPYARDSKHKKKITEAEYEGKTVKLNKPSRSNNPKKKFQVYVRDSSTGNVRKIYFGDPNMEIKRDDPGRRKNFRARHSCDENPPKTSARYWSCKMWSSKSVSDILANK